eukprot:1642754-Alexandrium_andersonii.AAC.1
MAKTTTPIFSWLAPPRSARNFRKGSKNKVEIENRSDHAPRPLRLAWVKTDLLHRQPVDI